MELDLRRFPFSAPDSYLAVSDLSRPVWGEKIEKEGLFLRALREGRFGSSGAVAELIPLYEGKPVSYRIRHEGWKLILQAQEGCITLVFDDRGRLRLRGEGLSLKLSTSAGVLDEYLVLGENSWFATAPGLSSKFLITALEGLAEVENPDLEDRVEGSCPAGRKREKILFFGPDRFWEGEVQEFAAVLNPGQRESFSGCLLEAEQGLNAYVSAASRGCPQRFLKTMEQAAYVNYTAQVSGGMLRGRVMLMSKNWETGVWSWDCQFNAIACASFDRQAAWDNFSFPFHYQHETGVLPDMVTDHGIITAYTKPPIHGWALSFLRRAGVLDLQQKAWAYAHLLKMVRSWYTCYDWDGDGVCQYNHGNDSGWDNCSCFLCGAPVEGPDLSSYLVLCWDELSVLAGELGYDEAAQEHRGQADRQLSRLLQHSWDGKRFHTYQNGTHREQKDSESLLLYLPIVLGERLPREIFRKLAEDLKVPGKFLSVCGLATESMNSPYYISDGYWRGPVWAPVTLLMVDGLFRGGEKKLASQLAERYCRNCASQGFSENYDAGTGQGLRDRCHTWASSVFMILARNYAEPDASFESQDIRR